METTPFNQKATSIIRLAVIGGGLVLIIGGMKTAAHIVNMVLLAYVLVLLTVPIHRWLTKRRVPSFVAVLFILLSIVGLFAIVGLFIGMSIAQLEKDLPAYQAQLMDTVTNVQTWLAGKGLDISTLPLPTSIPLSSIAQPALSFASKLFSGISSGISSIALVMVILFFALLENGRAVTRIQNAFASSRDTLASIRTVNDGLRKYIVLKAVTGAAMAVADTALLFAVGVEFAPLWGLLAFLMNFIPNIGFAIAVIPPVILAFLQFGLGKALIVLVGYVIINTLVNTILAPRIMGKGLNLSPTVIFIALLFWSWVLGGVGIFMAVPLLIMVKVLAGEYDDTRWLAEVVSGDGE